MSIMDDPLRTATVTVRMPENERTEEEDANQHGSSEVPDSEQERREWCSVSDFTHFSSISFL